MASIVEIDILLPSSVDPDPPSGGGRRGVTRRTIHIWINSPSFLTWHASADQLPGCQRGSYKDGDQQSKDVPPSGSAYYSDSGSLVFKLLQIKPGSGRDRIRPGDFEREGFWVDPPFPFQSKDFTYVVTAVDGKSESD
jgi:hypothetical protein